MTTILQPHPAVTIYVGDVLRTIKNVRDKSIQAIVTSPPYYGLRDYGVSGQHGLEASPQEWINMQLRVARELHRVLRDDGVLFVNLGDKHVGSGRSGGSGGKQERNKGSFTSRSRGRVQSDGLEDKQLMGMPWRYAFALQDNGWFLRMDSIWHKPQAMPESVRDRPARDHEYVFMFTKGPRYFYDDTAVMQPASENTHSRGNGGRNKAAEQGSGVKANKSFDKATVGHVEQRNLRSVWSINAQPYGGKHFAVYPVDLPLIALGASVSQHGACSACGAAWERVVKIERVKRERKPRLKESARAMPGVSPNQIHAEGAHDARTQRRTTVGWKPRCTCTTPAGDPPPVRPCMVLDPYGGAGTTALAALALGATTILHELNPDYAERAAERIQAEAAQAINRKVPQMRAPARTLPPTGRAILDLRQLSLFGGTP